VLLLPNCRQGTASTVSDVQAARLWRLRTSDVRLTIGFECYVGFSDASLLLHMQQAAPVSRKWVGPPLDSSSSLGNSPRVRCHQWCPAQGCVGLPELRPDMPSCCCGMCNKP